MSLRERLFGTKRPPAVDDDHIISDDVAERVKTILEDNDVPLEFEITEVEEVTEAGDEEPNIRDTAFENFDPERDVPPDQSAPRGTQQPEPTAKEGADKEYKRYSDDDLLELWRKHKETPEDDYEARNEIMESLGGYVENGMDYLRRNPFLRVPENLARADLMESMAKAIDRYDPEHSSGQTLKGYVWHNMFIGGNKRNPAIKSVVRKYGDMVQVRDRAFRSRIHKFREEKERFEQVEGREPSAAEMAEIMRIGKDEVNKLMFETAPTRFSEHRQVDDFRTDILRDPESSRRLNFVYNSLSGREQLLMQKLFYPKFGGTPPKSQLLKDIGEELGFQDYEVSKVIKKIRNKVERYQGL